MRFALKFSVKLIFKFANFKVMKILFGSLSCLAGIAFFAKFFIHLSIDKGLKNCFSFNPFIALGGYKVFLPIKKQGYNIKLVRLANFFLLLFYCFFLLSGILLINGRVNKNF